MLFGIAPIYCVIWALLRLVTLPFDRKVYASIDDILYSSYQKLVLFFCENVVGVEVRCSFICEKAFKSMYPGWGSGGERLS